MYLRENRETMRNILLVATAAVGLLITFTLFATLAGAASIVALVSGIALTGYAIMFVLYFTREKTAPLTTPMEETVAQPVATTTSPEVHDTTPVEKVTVTYYDFKGDIHDVIDVEGIGPKYADRLIGMGIETTARLCYEDAAKIAETIDAPVKTVQNWQAMAQLAKVNGIGKQYAEVLVRAGVDNIDALKRRSPNTIADQVNAYVDGLKSNVLGTRVTPRRVENWQKHAKTMRRVRQPVPTA